MDIDILINTTPIGMESDLCPIDTNIVIDKKLLVCDIVYKPQDTVFLKWAKKNNLEIIEYNISTNQEYKRELIKKGYLSVPVIVIDGQDVLGFDLTRIEQLTGVEA